MIKNREKLTKFYNKLIEQESFSFMEALAIYEELHREAVLLGAINHKNITEGLDVDIKIAGVLNKL